MGAFFAILALSSLGVRLAAGKAYDTWGAAVALVPMFLALAIGMTLLAVATDPVLFLSAAALAGLGIGGTHTTLISSVVDRSPPDAGPAASPDSPRAGSWESAAGRSSWAALQSAPASRPCS